MSVFVIGLTGCRLMPTTERKARILLKTGKAEVYQHRPFTIRLLYKTGSTIQDVILGVDTGGQHIQDVTQLFGDIGVGVVALMPKLFDLVCFQTEEEHILVAHLLVDLDVCSVEGADRDGTVDHELHIAGAGGFLAGDGDLFGDVCGGNDDLGKIDRGLSGSKGVVRLKAGERSRMAAVYTFSECSAKPPS